MDTTFIVRFTLMCLEALVLVLKLCFWGSLLSLLTGLFCALAWYFRIPVARHVAGAYIEIPATPP